MERPRKPHGREDALPQAGRDASGASATGEKELTKVFDHGIPSAAVTAVAKDGTLLGIRGQDYLVARPGELKAKLIPIPVEAGPRPMHFIKPDDQGRLWGGPPFGQTLFYMDLATKKTTNTGIVVNAGGEVYDVVVRRRQNLRRGVRGRRHFRLRPAQPWDQLGNKNPRSLARLNGKGYIRPVAGIHLGDDGKLYSGWMAQYGKYGGAIAITDRATGETKLWENPLGEQAISALAVAGDCIYAGTTLAGNGLPHEAERAAAVRHSRSRERSRAFRSSRSKAPKSRRSSTTRRADVVLLVVGPKLWRFNLRTNELYPADSPPITPHAADSQRRREDLVRQRQVARLLRYRRRATPRRSPTRRRRSIISTSRPTATIFIACGADVYRMKPAVAWASRPCLRRTGGTPMLLAAAKVRGSYA